MNKVFKNISNLSNGFKVVFIRSNKIRNGKIHIVWSILLVLFLSNFTVAQGITAELETFKKSIAEEIKLNYGKAVELMESIYVKNKDEYLINFRLGWLKYQAKQYTESIKYYKMAIEISENSVEALLAITYPLDKLSKWDELVDTYDSILEQDEENYAATKQLGIIYFNRKNYRKSNGYFEDLLINYPSDYYANIYLGWNYLNLGSKSKAEKYFSTVLLFYPDDKSAKDGLKFSR